MATPTPIITEGPYVRIENSGLSSYTTTLTGNTSLSGDANPVATWQWVKVSSSLGDDSSVTLVNATTDTVTIEDIAPGEAIRVMLRLTNSSAEASVTTPYPVQSGTTPFSFATAPATAFCDIAVALPNSALVKSPPGARDWATRSHYPLVDEVESLAGRVAAVEDQQVAPAGHSFSELDTGLLGTVRLLGPPVNAAEPYVVNQVEYHYSWQLPGALAVPALQAPLVAIQVPADCYVWSVSGVVLDRGDYSTTVGDYISLQVKTLSVSDFDSALYVAATTVAGMTWAYGSSSKVGVPSAMPATLIPGSNIVYVTLTVVPDTAPASDLSVSLVLYRRI